MRLAGGSTGGYIAAEDREFVALSQTEDDRRRNEEEKRERKAKDRLYRAIETAQSFATETAAIAKRSEIAPEIIIALLAPGERTLQKFEADRRTTRSCSRSR